MTGTPRIRAFLPATFHRLASGAGRAGDAPQVFRQFARTLGRLERTASTRKPGGEGA
jgi:hypothetical protein